MHTEYISQTEEKHPTEWNYAKRQEHTLRQFENGEEGEEESYFPPVN